jgi:hypothetical protein
MKSVIVALADIPRAANYDVRTSSFFQHHNKLPSPEEVRSQARAQYLSGNHWGWKKRDVSEVYNSRPAPAVFEDMSLFVKWGSEIQVSEGQTLYTIRNSCGDFVPVPEIYGWRRDGDETFLYMEAISGKTLEDAWPEMEEDDRLRVCGEIRTILHNLRRLKQNPTDKFIGESRYSEAIFTTHSTLTSHCLGNITRNNYYERALRLASQPETGPFNSLKDFHGWFIFQYKRKMPDPETVPEPYRAHLPDDSEITFTHGDLHRSNILVSATPPRVTALIDWEQSGWLPAYWESCKAHWTASYLSDWAVKYLPLVLDQSDESVQEAWDYYTDSVGC